ncbi:hypothetical protein C8F01DRAFT_1079915 [Mycena amicta]|nr:hypothetical protein C8F01DRAFT_1079915 [Mycena amicta]
MAIHGKWTHLLDQCTSGVNSASQVHYPSRLAVPVRPRAGQHPTGRLIDVSDGESELEGDSKLELEGDTELELEGDSELASNARSLKVLTRRQEEQLERKRGERTEREHEEERKEGEDKGGVRAAGRAIDLAWWEETQGDNLFDDEISIPTSPAVKMECVSDEGACSSDELDVLEAVHKPQGHGGREGAPEKAKQFFSNGAINKFVKCNIGHHENSPESFLSGRWRQDKHQRRKEREEKYVRKQGGHREDGDDGDDSVRDKRRAEKRQDSPENPNAHLALTAPLPLPPTLPFSSQLIPRSHCLVTMPSTMPSPPPLPFLHRFPFHPPSPTRPTAPAHANTFHSTTARTSSYVRSPLFASMTLNAATGSSFSTVSQDATIDAPEIDMQFQNLQNLVDVNVVDRTRPPSPEPHAFTFAVPIVPRQGPELPRPPTPYPSEMLDLEEQRQPIRRIDPRPRIIVPPQPVPAAEPTSFDLEFRRVSDTVASTAHGMHYSFWKNETQRLTSLNLAESSPMVSPNPNSVNPFVPSSPTLAEMSSFQRLLFTDAMLTGIYPRQHPQIIAVLQKQLAAEEAIARLRASERELDGESMRIHLEAVQIREGEGSVEERKQKLREHFSRSLALKSRITHLQSLFHQADDDSHRAVDILTDALSDVMDTFDDDESPPWTLTADFGNDTMVDGELRMVDSDETAKESRGGGRMEEENQDFGSFTVSGRPVARYGSNNPSWDSLPSLLTVSSSSEFPESSDFPGSPTTSDDEWGLFGRYHRLSVLDSGAPWYTRLGQFPIWIQNVTNVTYHHKLSHLY